MDARTLLGDDLNAMNYPKRCESYNTQTFRMQSHPFVCLRGNVCIFRTYAKHFRQISHPFAELPKEPHKSYAHIAPKITFGATDVRSVSSEKKKNGNYIG